MKVLCIGRNYREHAEELGNEAPDEPLFFLKTPSSLLWGGGSMDHPPHTNELQYETELVLRIGKEGKGIPGDGALDHIESVGIGFDLTARDRQRELKEKGHPWEKAKAFDHSAPVSETFIPIGELPNPILFRAEKNGRTVQTGDSSKMIFPFEKLIAHLSRYMTLEEGDLIFTGTPKGVGSLVTGDRLEAFLEERSLLRLRIH